MCTLMRDISFMRSTGASSKLPSTTAPFANAAVERGAQAVDDAALALRVDRVGVDDLAAIDRADDAPHRQAAVFGNAALRASELLLTSTLTLEQIAHRCGFADQSHLSRVFTATIGIPPGEWRRQRRN